MSPVPRDREELGYPPVSDATRQGSRAGANVQLTAEQVGKIREILVCKGVDTARHGPVIFGSRTGGKARRYSDVDIGITGEPLTLIELGDVAEAFDESDLPYAVDIVNLATASEAFRELANATAVRLTDAIGTGA